MVVYGEKTVLPGFGKWVWVGTVAAPPPPSISRQLYTTANTLYTIPQFQQLLQNVPPHLMNESVAWFAAPEPQTQSGIRTIPITIFLSSVFMIFANFCRLR